ncbi:MAG: hypothetical protein IJX19_07695 [Clostridia bacterium]|nr:hypothetical protein [Clostridia bacterium]
MKKQSLWIRLLGLTLALIMTVSVFAACATEDEEGSADASQSEVDGSEGTTEPVGETDENGFLLDDLPEDLKFDETVRILGVEEYKYQFYFKEEDVGEDPIAQIIYKRNETVEERLGVEFEWDFSKGEWGSRNTFLKAVETACETDPYDAMSCYNLVPYMLAQKGLCANLYGDNYLDLTAPWWPEAQISELLINDTLYAVTESNEKGLLVNMMAMFFNNTLLEAKKLESPYELVKKNEWTIDKFSSMIKETYEDKNGDGKADSGDIYGFINATESKSDAWFYALGYRFSEKQNDQVVSFVEDPKIQDYVDTMLTFYDSKDVMRADVSKYGGIGQCKMFYTEQVYFYSSAIFMGEAANNEGINFGVVPLPKLNSQQDRYYTHISNTYDTWCVSHNADDIDLSSAVLECMASESYRKTGPLYYDVNIKLRYAPDERLGEMYDLVRDSVTFDLIYLYSCAYPDAGSAPKELVKKCVLSPTSAQWASSLAANKDTWSQSFSAILETYQK